jgi:hemerythrin-like domain-containing protein
MSTLSEANQRWHSQLDSSYQAFLESLTALDFSRARGQWTNFESSLKAHIELEHANIEPLTENWEGNTLKLIQSDHLILNRLLPRLETALTLIERADATRTELVRKLDGFIKMRNVLEHHDLREKETLYPLLEEQLDDAHLQALSGRMDQARKAPGVCRT